DYYCQVWDSSSKGLF
nr:immunoglobulin light chain junction region [Macaca mulatta]MOW57344.1 immunoglobulin light chain junction region [Macaca mulatta]MOW57547.1 immunoglobulin light chain junction region [Macaca mulatta]